MTYANLAEFWFDKRQSLCMFNFANSSEGCKNWYFFIPIKFDVEKSG